MLWRSAMDIAPAVHGRRGGIRLRVHVFEPEDSPALATRVLSRTTASIGLDVRRVGWSTEKEREAAAFELSRYEDALVAATGERFDAVVTHGGRLRGIGFAVVEGDGWTLATTSDFLAAELFAPARPDALGAEDVLGAVRPPPPTAAALDLSLATVAAAATIATTVGAATALAARYLMLVYGRLKAERPRTLYITSHGTFHDATGPAQAQILRKLSEGRGPLMFATGWGVEDKGESLAASTCAPDALLLEGGAFLYKRPPDDAARAGDVSAWKECALFQPRDFEVAARAVRGLVEELRRTNVLRNVVLFPQANRGSVCVYVNPSRGTRDTHIRKMAKAHAGRSLSTVEDILRAVEEKRAMPGMPAPRSRHEADWFERGLPPVDVQIDAVGDRRLRVRGPPYDAYVAIRLLQRFRPWRPFGVTCNADATFVELLDDDVAYDEVEETPGLVPDKIERIRQNVLESEGSPPQREFARRVFAHDDACIDVLLVGKENLAHERYFRDLVEHLPTLRAALDAKEEVRLVYIPKNSEADAHLLDRLTPRRDGTGKLQPSPIPNARLEPFVSSAANPKVVEAVQNAHGRPIPSRNHIEALEWVLEREARAYWVPGPSGAEIADGRR